MRILAIDYGSKRLGLAISDPLRITAQPLTSLEREGQRKDIAAIGVICQEWQVGTIVIGLPRNMDGSPAVHYQDVLDFSGLLTKEFSIPVEHWDERLSTAEAERLLLSNNTSRSKRKKVIDKMAATIILQSWMAANPGN